MKIALTQRSYYFPERDEKRDYLTKIGSGYSLEIYVFLYRIL